MLGCLDDGLRLIATVRGASRSRDRAWRSRTTSGCGWRSTSTAPILPGTLPGRFVWVPWDEALLAEHAEVKYQSFRGEIDACVFPCLGDRYGCQRLMREIRRKPGFLPGATWLIACPEGYVGTVQGVMDHGPIGAIQNLGVIPAYRGIGLGRALVHRALIGFPPGGAAPGLSGSHRREQRRRPALPRASASAGPRPCTRPSTDE